MNGINIPKNVSDNLQYALINATDSLEFEDRIKDAIRQLTVSGYKILNIDIKQPVVYDNHIWHYVHIFYYKP
mgnify:CR=1 FL=1